MNKTELKNFAVSARRDLLEKVGLRAKIFGIDEKNDLKMEEQFGQIIVNGTGYPIQMKSAFHSLASQLKTKGYEQLIEEVAYTWFNRIIAIRYMEVHEYLPSRVNILSSKTGKAEPDILTLFETIDLEVDVPAIKEIIHHGNTEEAYRKLFIAQCNALNKILPFLFEKINDYTELLLPDFLLDSESVISKLTKNEALTESFREVEVIGWLYQFYNSEPKDKVFANLKKNKKIEKYDIPAATQLFTPKWIVQYMVENTLGQLWLEANPDSLLKQHMHYYIEPTEQEEDVKQELEKIRYKNVNIEEITIIDPCVGSGHILVYAFDLLYQMYEEAGYPPTEIPTLILEKNLFGLDIDDRAAQLASFALIMKARKKSRRIFWKNVQLNIYSIQESNHLDKDGIVKLLGKDEKEKKEIISIIDSFSNAQNFGSILKPIKVNHDKYLDKINELGQEQLSFDTFLAYEQIKHVQNLFIQSKILSSNYDVAITNPPYMGAKGFNKKLNEYIKGYYPDSKYDLYAVFIERLFAFIKESGFCTLINQHSWMFLGSYEKLRKKIINNYTIFNMLHLGSRAFEDIGGEVVQSTSYVLRNSKIPSYNSTYLRLVDIPNAKQKELNFNNKKYRYYCKQKDFDLIPSSPITYWVSQDIRMIFVKEENLGSIGEPRTGLQTNANDRFVRLWHEICFEKIGFNFGNGQDAKSSGKKWFPYNKGGKFRKWYGNLEYVVNWENDGKEIKELATELYKSYTRTAKNIPYYFKTGITWSDLTTGGFSARYIPKGFIFDTVGPTLFVNSDQYFYETIAYMNSKTFQTFLDMTLTGLHYNNGVLRNLPYKVIKNKNISNKSKENIIISKNDWDAFETSWNFNGHPFLKFRQGSARLEIINTKWEYYTNNQIEIILKNQDEINDFFQALYNIKDVYNSDDKYEEEATKLYRANRAYDTKTLLSYFIGCVMGRYSLDVEGLAFAGGEWNDSKHQTFKPNKYGLIHLTNEYYFEDDIIARLREFLSVTFGSETVDENLQWLAESLELKRNESAEDRLRRYFLDEFFKDHCQVYQKRPIYCLVDSGKQKGLRTLIYMHRYQPDTVATIRFEHLQEIQAKYHYEISAVDARIVNPNLSATEKRELEKRKTDFQKRLDELLEFDKKLAEYANAQISIDLDDGVNVNYQKFEKVLAKIK